ncbi:MAG: hypothetical protein FWG70_01830 [Oscillospiraceae bacterium]|nr:hypothetical protein [Oscillospiraceae bacterium]
MKTTLIILKSMTEAGKARHHLEKFKTNAIVEKVTLKGGGCGYGVRVKEDAGKVCRQLGLVGIECIEIK